MKMNEKVEKELDKQFPKGDKARGRALVLHAIAQIEINELEKKRKYWENKYKKIDEEEYKIKIPVTPLIVGGVLLIVFIFTFIVWDDIKITVGAIFGDEIAGYKKECETQCKLGDKNLFCCDPKGIYIEERSEVYTCQDKILKIDCKLNCKKVCFNLCKDITEMIPCAESGCTWTSKNYCKPKEGT